MSKKTKCAATPPAYMPGDKIVSDEIAGRISGCFWYKGQWNYVIDGLIGVDRHSPPPDPAKPTELRLGSAYIAEKNIKWFDNGIRWQEVTDGKQQ